MKSLAYQQLSDFLFAEWDPLQINGNKKLADEYDSYMSTIMPLVNQRNVEEIANTLDFIEEVDFGITADHEQNLRVARKMIEKLVNVARTGD